MNKLNDPGEMYGEIFGIGTESQEFEVDQLYILYTILYNLKEMWSRGNYRLTERCEIVISIGNREQVKIIVKMWMD